MDVPAVVAYPLSMIRILLTAVTFSFLAGCAATPSYGPAARAGDYGYLDQKIETGRYRVSYRAKGQAAADDGALRRAAEITLQEGGEWFRVLSRDAEAVSGRSGSSIGIGGATGGRNSSVGVGVQLPLGGGGTDEVTIRLEILIGSGEKPDLPGIYDARQVLGNLGGTTLGRSGLTS